MKTVTITAMRMTAAAIGLVCYLAVGLQAQDFITTTMGEVIPCKVISLDNENVQYETASQPGTVAHLLALALVAKIAYQDGTVKAFNVPEPTKNNEPYNPSKGSQPNGTPIQPTSSPKKERRAAFYLATHNAHSVPLSLYMGILTNGIGLYVGGRASINFLDVYTDTYYFVENGYVNSTDYIFSATSEPETMRASVTLGLTAKLLGRVKAVSLHGYAGAGYGISKVVQEFSQEDPIYGYAYDGLWLEHQDASDYGVELEGGLIFNLFFINLNLGVNTLNLKSPAATFGLGFAF